MHVPVLFVRICFDSAGHLRTEYQGGFAPDHRGSSNSCRQTSTSSLGLWYLKDPRVSDDHPCISSFWLLPWRYLWFPFTYPCHLAQHPKSGNKSIWLVDCIWSCMLWRPTSKIQRSLPNHSEWCIPLIRTQSLHFSHSQVVESTASALAQFAVDHVLRHILGKNYAVRLLLESLEWHRNCRFVATAVPLGTFE